MDPLNQCLTIGIEIIFLPLNACYTVTGKESERRNSKAEEFVDFQYFFGTTYSFKYHLQISI